ncbi:Hypothetical Protein FCC1311_060962 [Hondaea fermentalgiana]|uniref:Uncharacterized protein n=1 Tax=Hondaea fermentalgiana TaxID=2315210 RepID=A0A2R5GG40_9STRA|nr:Hypothetical Protein FCC1311_060962 [Hondaea fermentalgiana]|eukprot:GBG29876.1 Hypothetical Protein FCC1311_060962 [Hondaea fermentalgiana]
MVDADFDALVRDLRAHAQPAALGLTVRDLAPGRRPRPSRKPAEDDDAHALQGTKNDEEFDSSDEHNNDVHFGDVALYVSGVEGRPVGKEDGASDTESRFFFGKERRAAQRKQVKDHHAKAQNARSADQLSSLRRKKMQKEQPSPDETKPPPRKRGRRKKVLPRTEIATEVSVSLDADAAARAQKALAQLASHKSEKASRKIERMQRKARKKLKTLARQSGVKPPSSSSSLFSKSSFSMAQGKTESSKKVESPRTDAITLIPSIAGARAPSASMSGMSAFRALRQQDLFAYSVPLDSDQDKLASSQSTGHEQASNHVTANANVDDDFGDLSLFQDVSQAPGRQRRHYLLADRRNGG